MPRLLSAPTRMVRSRVFDSSRWDGYRPRPDDIIIGTHAKCGTTWMQRIVGMLVFASAAPQPLGAISPWFDMRMSGPLEAALATAEAQTHRRFLKTHLPLDAMPIYEGVKFIHVARDGRDAALSMHNHLLNFTAETLQRFDAVCVADPKFGDRYPRAPTSPAEFFTDWMADGGARGDPGASFFHTENSYWEARSSPDMLLVHYNDLKADRGGEMRRVAAYLGIEIAETLWPELIEAASFESMKSQGDTLLPGARSVWTGGASRFINQGANGRWQGVFFPEDLERYQEAVERHFAPDLADWVANGRLGGG